jgi:hypothetical protein
VLAVWLLLLVRQVNPGELAQPRVVNFELSRHGLWRAVSRACARGDASRCCPAHCRVMPAGSAFVLSRFDVQEVYSR